MLRYVHERPLDDRTSGPERSADEAGFSLIELMVVLLIIAILLAIAIPTFLGVTGSSNDRATQSNLTNGLTEALAVFHSKSQSFSGVSAALVSSAPEFSWYAHNVGAPAGSNGISIASVDVAQSGDARGLIMAGLSKTGYCWWVAQLNATPTTIASTGFQTAASGVGAQTGATAAGTYYASKRVGFPAAFTAAKCTANYPENAAGAFAWGPSYSSSGTAG